MNLKFNKFWKIKETKNKGKGLFAAKEISKGTIIGDYLGFILRPEDAIVDEENIYLMYYSDSAVISPNFKKPGIYLLNHSCVPNCFLYIYKNHTLIFALFDIKKNEELTIPYLLPPKDKFCRPCKHICKCGNLRCVGTMHLSKKIYSKWRKFSDIKNKKIKEEKIKYGKELPKLNKYPEKISETYIREIKNIFNYVL